MHDTVMPLAEGHEEKIGSQERTFAEGPLFVVGMFRSGTSLLYALLNQHPRISLMYEADLEHVHSLFWVRRSTSSWLAKWDFWNGAFSRHKLDSSRIPEGIHDLPGAARAVYQEYARPKETADIWGCKSPTYYDEMARLSRTFPNARFIIIWRDLRSICRSLVAAQVDNIFFSRKGMLLRAILGYREMKTQCDLLTRRGVPVHQLHYEELVRDPGVAMQGVCEFLQIAFDPRMTHLEGADRSAIQEGSHHTLVKSEKILASKASPAPPPTSLKRKVDRYIQLWRTESGGAWPRYPQAKADEDQDKPALLERASDRAAYEVLSLWHHTIPVIFSCVPLALWKKYRSFNDARRYRRLLRKAESSAD